MESKVTTLTEVKQLMTGVLEKLDAAGGVKNVYCVACGGSHGSMYPMEYFINNEAKALSVFSVTANEFVHKLPKNLGENSLVFAMSLGGGTKETLAAATAAKEKGSIVIALSGSADSALARLADFSVVYSIDIGTPVNEQNQYMALALATELLNQTEGYDYYEQMIDGLNKIRLVCDKAVQKIHPAALKFGEEHKDVPVLYTMASGASYGVAYMQSICLFMEMEWIHSSAIHTAEYFHGPFEVTEPGVPFLIFVSDGPTRALDERALDFLRKHSDQVTVLDAKELGVSIIDDAVVEYFNPLVHWAAGIEYAEGLALAKKHPLLQRRYMGKLVY